MSPLIPEQPVWILGIDRISVVFAFRRGIDACYEVVSRGVQRSLYVKAQAMRRIVKLGRCTLRCLTSSSRWVRLDEVRQRNVQLDKGVGRQREQLFPRPRERVQIHVATSDRFAGRLFVGMNTVFDDQR